MIDWAEQIYPTRVQRLNRAGIRDCNWLWSASADIKLALVWVSSFMEPHYEPLVCGSGPGDALAAVGFKIKKKSFK